MSNTQKVFCVIVGIVVLIAIIILGNKLVDNHNSMVIQETISRQEVKQGWKELDRTTDSQGSMIVTYKRNGWVGTPWDMIMVYGSDGKLFKVITRDNNY